MPSEAVMMMILMGSFGTIVLGIALLVTSAMIAVSGDQPREDTLLLTLTVAGWALIVVGLFGFCIFLLSPLGIVLAVVVAMVIAVVVAMVIAEIAVELRATRQHALLWVLTTATERRLPLVPAVEAFARQRRGMAARRMRWLARLLADGVPLPDALGQTHSLAPAEALPIIHVGHQSGALAVALRRVAATRDSRHDLWFSLTRKLLYLCGLVAFWIGILTFAMLFIIPAYRKIFEDFETRLPAITEALIYGSTFFADASRLLLLVFLGAFLLSIYAILRYIGCIRWGLPGFDWMVRRLDTAVILEALALAAERQYPLHETVDTLAHSYHKGSIRRRLRDVVRDLEAGEDWLESLLRRGLIKRADLAVLRAAQRVGNLPWALREMADSNRRRLAYRLYALLQVCFPPVILALAALVMFFVVSLFLPLIALIEKMTL